MQCLSVEYISTCTLYEGCEIVVKFNDNEVRAKSIRLDIYNDHIGGELQLSLINTLPIGSRIDITIIKDTYEDEHKQHIIIIKNASQYACGRRKFAFTSDSLETMYLHS